VGLLTPAMEDVLARFPSPVMVDAGSGNAYLAFVLYELFFREMERGEIVCLEARDDLTLRARERAERLGYRRMRFVTAALEDTAHWPERPHLVTALHACDTATDDALAGALRRNAEHIAVVPCCQAEVSQQLKERRAESSPAMQPLFAHAWHRREFGSHLTNVIRALVLESRGYQVTVTELTGWEHSLKNELILARRVHRENRDARKRLEALLAETKVAPKLVRTLAGP
jgi:hypothetical protein